MTFDPRFQARPGVQMMTVTSALAELWLNHNDLNRPLRHSWVANLAEQMTSNQYISHASIISFSNTGRLLNGQHTLHAIRMSNTTHTLTIQSGMPEESFSAYDRGVTRTLSDVTKIDPKIVAILRCIDTASIGHVKFNNRMTPSRTRELYEKSKEALDFVISIRNWVKTLKPAPVPAAFVAWYYCLPQHEGKEWIKTILRWLAHDEDVINEMAQPQIVNAWLHFTQTQSSAFTTCSGAYRLVLFYKAWNLFDHRCANNRKIIAANKDIVTAKIKSIFSPIENNNPQTHLDRPAHRAQGTSTRIREIV